MNLCELNLSLNESLNLKNELMTDSIDKVKILNEKRIFGLKDIF